jgi:HTH-type transcriptional regulator/antitoxin HigA
MNSLKYTIIKTTAQYHEYCDILENLTNADNNVFKDELELLGLLIEKWDIEHQSLWDLDPVELIKALSEENHLKSKDLAQILGLSKGTVSKILNYQKGISKETIRKLSAYFKVSQDAFNRPYKLINQINKHFGNASLINMEKNMENVVT